MSTESTPGNVPLNDGLGPTPEPVHRLRRYAGLTMRTARSPNMTAREAISVGNWLAAMDAELAEWRKLRDPANLHVNLLRGQPAQLTREQAMHLCADDLQRMAELEAVAKHEADCAEAFKAEADDLRQQLADEKRQHDVTRGELERTRLVRDEAMRDLDNLHRSNYREAVGRA